MIKGKNVILRAMEADDLEFCQQMYNDPWLRQMVVGWDFPVSLDAQKKWFQTLAGNKSGVRFIVETKEKVRVGLTGLWDIDWHNRNALTATKLIVSEEIKGKGYGRDAIMTMNAYAFYEVGLERLWGAILDFNIPSYKAYVEKSGWKVEGRFRRHIFRNGVFHDLYYVACLKEDFLAVPDSKDYIPPENPGDMPLMDFPVFTEEN